MEKPPNAGRGDRENRLHRNAALSAFQLADVGAVHTPLRKSSVCAHGGIGIRSLPEETGEPCRSQAMR